MAPPKGFKPHNKKDIDLELMQYLYYNQRKDFKWIANYFGLKSKSAIYDRFKKLNLKARTNTDLKTGTKHSEQTKKKISMSGIGRIHSKETRKRISEKHIGENNSMFINGSTIQNGYVFIWINGKRIREHRYIWVKHNGIIPKGMCIHHKDLDKQNNNINNLQLVTHSEHTTIHNFKHQQYHPRKHNSKGQFM